MVIWELSPFICVFGGWLLMGELLTGYNANTENVNAFINMPAKVS
jgi:hypothetical protein